MASLEPTLRDKGFQNWLKGALAILFAKQGLDDFIAVELDQFQKDLLSSVFKTKAKPAGTVCVSCTTENILPCPTQNFCPTGKRCSLHNRNIPGKQPGKPCPNNICQDLEKGIRREHRYNSPSWRNTDATKWCTDAFDIAKCYMPPSGYSTITSLENTDFNGTLAVIINNKRFQNKMSAQLNQQSNICIKAREVGRQIRHSADFTLLESDLISYIDILIDLLSDSKYLTTDPKAQEALNKMKQLKSNALTVTTEDITSVLDDAIININGQENVKQGDNRDENKTEADIKQKQLFNDIKASLSDMLTVCLDTVKISVLDGIQKEGERSKEEIRKEKELIKEEIRKEKEDQRRTEEEKNKLGYFEKRRLQKSLKEDIAAFYRRSHSTIPVSPVVRQHDVPLIDFYVQPKLRSVEISYKLNEFGSFPAKSPIISYKDLLLCENEPHKEIYVTAKAGVGKTSYAKRLCMAWCQAHYPDKKLNERFDKDDINTMKKFDYLFMILLKETEMNMCCVDDMIYYLIKTYLPRFRGYTRLFIEKILHEQHVLIILDGLDEWAHPNSCRRKGEEIPHRLTHPSCTIITTTRSWKYASVNLNDSQIDMHAEICDFDDISSRELVTSATSLLNKIFGKSKSADVIQDTITKAKLGPLKRIPFILLQMTCLLFDGLSIGESKCEIYSNVLELTLECANLEPPQEVKEEPAETSTPPSCIPLLCSSRYKMLLRLGRLAFESLTGSTSKHMLTLDTDVVHKLLSPQSLEYFLNVGLLTQTKDYEHAANSCSYFSFQDKSFQEYFAALYIQSCFDSEDTQRHLLQACDTIEDILRIGSLFTFLGGFNPVACGKYMHLMLKTIVSKDESTQRYRSYLSGRTSLVECRKTWEIFKSFQDLQLNIVEEIISNGHTLIPLYLEDVVLDGAYVADKDRLLIPILEKSKGNIKSFCIEQCRSIEEFSEILEKFELQNLPCLDKLVISAVPREKDLHQLLSGSVNTMRCLDICFALYRYNKYFTEYTYLQSITVQTIFDMKQLQSIRLNSIRLTHSDIESLVKFVNDKTELKEIGLCHIMCTDHTEHCSGCCLDLSGHLNLETIRLGNVPVSDLRVDPSSLRYCYTGSLSTCVHASLVRCLPNAANLHTLRLKKLSREQVLLYMLKTVPLLKHLKNIALEISEIPDVENVTPTLPSDIENLHLYDITLSCKTFKDLIDGIRCLSHTVTINLQNCSVTPETDYQKMMDEIKSSPQKYKVRFDDKKSRIFSFQSRQ